MGTLKESIQHELHLFEPKSLENYFSLVSKFQIHSYDHVCNNVVKYVLNSLKYSIVWGIHLVVEFSNCNIVSQPKKGLIQIVQFEIMREVIYWVLKSVCMKKHMGFPMMCS